jgi:hypothetical protein
LKALVSLAHGGHRRLSLAYIWDCCAHNLHSTDPPQIATDKFASYYRANASKLLVPPSIHTPIINNDYRRNYNRIARQFDIGNVQKVQDWTAVYYGMIEQVDAWVGLLLDELDQQGARNNTLVVFTADHGEMLGSHGLKGKAVLYEEAVRVPLLMRLPEVIAQGTVVQRPVGHIDVFATLMDYMGYSALDGSDGKSLRPAISSSGYRETYDDAVAVSEAGGAGLHFMVRHGTWKMFIATPASSTTQDMMFDVGSDPFEMQDFLAVGNVMTPALVGKAEHLKILLLEWMLRNDGSQKYFSQPNGLGYTAAIANRRTWRTVDQWQSDVNLAFDTPVYVNGLWRSTAWLYIGRTTPGLLLIKNVSLMGNGAQLFALSDRRGRIRQNGFMRIRISFESATVIDPSTLAVQVVIQSNVYNRRVISIVPW